MRYTTLLILLTTALTTTLCTAPKPTERPSSRISKDSFFSNYLDDSVSFQVYHPAKYSEFDSLPVLYLLHGHGGSDSSWVKSSEGNIQWLLDSLIDNKLIPRVMAVTLNGSNTWYVDSDQKMESTYIQEFIPLIDSAFAENTQDHYRILVGNSAGGYGALRFSLKYPDLFQASILLSPAAYYPEPPMNSSSRKIDIYKTDTFFDVEIWKSYAHLSLINQNKTIKTLPKFYISTGDDDEYQIVKVVTDLKSLLDENHIRNELTIVNGIHDWKVWNNRFCHDIIKVFKDLEH